MGSRPSRASGVAVLALGVALALVATWTGLPTFYLFAGVVGLVGLSRLRRATEPDRRRVIQGSSPTRPAGTDPPETAPARTTGPDPAEPPAESTAPRVPQQVRIQVVELANAGRTVEAIEVLREATGMELYEASQYVRTARRSVQ